MAFNKAFVLILVSTTLHIDGFRLFPRYGKPRSPFKRQSVGRIPGGSSSRAGVASRDRVTKTAPLEIAPHSHKGAVLQPTDDASGASSPHGVNISLSQLSQSSHDLQQVDKRQQDANHTDLPVVGIPVILRIYHVSSFTKGVSGLTRRIGYGVAYHCGVVVNGNREYEFNGAQGVVAIETGQPNIAYEFEEEIHVGTTSLSADKVYRKVVRKLLPRWQPSDYDAVNKNCCHFAEELLCDVLGFETINSTDCNAIFEEKYNLMATKAAENMMISGIGASSKSSTTATKVEAP